MAAEDAMDNVVDWTKDHKPVAIGIVGTVVLALALFTIRKRNAANGVGGATAAGVGSASLVPYGDATSMGFTGLTGIQDATAGGFAGLSDQLAGITGILTTLAVPGQAATGGADTGNTVPTIPGIGGTSPSGNAALPAAVPAALYTPPAYTAPATNLNLMPDNAPPPVAAPALVPTPAAPATVRPPTSSFTPTPVPAALSSAIAQVGGGVAQDQRTNVGGVRALSSFSKADQAIIRSGGTVVGGDGRVFKNVIGSDGTPHATSIGMYGQVV